MISIIVPVFNQLAYTVECFNSLFANTAPDKYELIVIDNGSQDPTPEYLETISARKTIIRNGRNLGVAPAWNQGIKASQYHYVCIINNDILFPPRWLVNFEEAFAKHGETGAWYPRAIRANRFEWYKTKDALSRLPLETIRFTIKRPHDQVVPAEYENEDNRGNLGYFQIYRKGVFDKIGLFDEQFRMFCREDIDFFMRLEESAIVRRQLRNVIIFHYESVTVSTIDRSETDRYIGENFERFKQKWGFL